MEEIVIKKANNGWVIVSRGEDGEELEAYESIKVDDSIPKSEQQHEQECLAFVEALQSINEKMGPGIVDDSSFSVDVKIQRLASDEPPPVSE